MARALQYIEIDIDYCSLTYGIAPCTASIPTTGAQKCFNTLATCQDIPHFTNVPKTLRFAVPTQVLPLDTIDAIPSIKSIQFDPATISLGQNLGQRATITVTFEDHPHSDTGLDKYVSNSPSDRAYDPYYQGTFWGKFRARVPYLRGRPLRWINGYFGQTLAEMETRYYVIDSFSGPSSNGEYVLIAKDVLKLADGDRAMAPAPSLGFLSADITAVSNSLTLSPAGAAAGYQRPFGYASIAGSEIVTYNNQQGFAAGGSPNAVTFDGVNDYYRRVGGLSGAADSKQFTISGWIRRLDPILSPVLGQRIFTSSNALAGATSLTRFVLSTVDDSFSFTGSNAAGTTICNISSTTVPAPNFWYHFLFSVDLSSTSKRHMYVNDVDVMGTPVTYTNDTMDFTMADFAIGANCDGSSKLHADLADLWIAPGVYVDFSVEANRRQFITADGRPVPLGANGERPLGNSPAARPLMFFNAAAPNWHVNAGTGGGFTPQGATNTPAATFSDGDVMHLITRGDLNTTAEDHSAQDRFQQVLQYLPQDPAFIIYDLLKNYAGISTAFLPLDTWANETIHFLNRLYSAYIAQPTSVAELVSELIEQAGLAMWWDDKTQEVRLIVLRGAVAEGLPLTEDNTIAGSLAIAEQPDKRLSSVHTYYAQINPLTSLSEPTNFRSLAVATDTDAEALYGSPQIKEIFSRWIPAGGRTTADRINTILLGRFTDPPRHFRLQTFRDTVSAWYLGTVYNLSAWPLQAADGSALAAAIQVTRLKPAADIFEIEADEMLFTVAPEDLGTRTIILDSNINNFNAKTTHDLLYPAASSGDAVEIIVNAGVTVGSTATTLRAFDIGTWPTGVSITLTVNGRIEGAGGDGGRGGVGAPPAPVAVPAENGGGGGVALYTRKAITLINNGIIYGGGGGGGGGAFVGTIQSAGGGGGAGANPGLGRPGWNGGAGLDPPGSSNHGRDGTPDAGGAGGANFVPAFNAGAGGNPGTAGVASSGTGGAAGAAIDGVSFCTITTAGTRAGPEIN